MFRHPTWNSATSITLGYFIRKQAISKPHNTAIRKYAGKVVNAANDLSEILDQENEVSNQMQAIESD
jgi:hypothetical protein